MPNNINPNTLQILTSAIRRNESYYGPLMNLNNE